MPTPEEIARELGLPPDAFDTTTQTSAPPEVIELIKALSGDTGVYPSAEQYRSYAASLPGFQAVAEHQQGYEARREALRQRLAAVPRRRGARMGEDIDAMIEALLARMTNAVVEPTAKTLQEGGLLGLLGEALPSQRALEEVVAGSIAAVSGREAAKRFVESRLKKRRAESAPSGAGMHYRLPPMAEVEALAANQKEADSEDIFQKTLAAMRADPAFVPFFKMRGNVFQEPTEADRTMVPEGFAGTDGKRSGPGFPTDIERLMATIAAEREAEIRKANNTAAVTAGGKILSEAVDPSRGMEAVNMLFQALQSLPR